MIIDRETFREMAVRLRRASDATLAAATHLAILTSHDGGPEEHWAGALDSFFAMNTEVCLMEKILRAVMEANREEESPSPLVS